MQCPSGISFSTDAPCSSPLMSSELLNHVCDLCVFSYSDICFYVPIFEAHPFYQGVASFVFQFKPTFFRSSFHRVCSFPYLCFEISHHHRGLVSLKFHLCRCRSY